MGSAHDLQADIFQLTARCRAECLGDSARFQLSPCLSFVVDDIDVAVVMPPAHA